MLEMTGPEVEDEVQRALDEMPALETVDSEEQFDNGSTEDGNLPVNAVAAAILTAAICGIYHRIIKYIIKNRTK